jgi:hypothetical protein
MTGIFISSSIYFHQLIQLFVYTQGVIVGTPARSKVVRNLLKDIGHAPLPSNDHVLEVVTAKRVQTTSSEKVKKTTWKT